MLSVDMSSVPSVSIAGFVPYRTPWIHFRRVTDEYVLYVICSGELYIMENGVPYALKSGDFFFLEPGLEHYGYKRSKCDYYYVHFKHPSIRTSQDPAESDSELQDDGGEAAFCRLPKYHHISRESDFLLYDRLLDAMTVENRHKNAGYRHVLAGKLMELFVLIHRSGYDSALSKDRRNAKSYAKVRELSSYLRREYREKITSADIEREFGLNFDYLNRIYKKITGDTIFHYLNAFRIEIAKELMDTTPLRLGEIGYFVGIDDPYYFSKCFKKFAGMTPMQYAKRRSIDLE